MARRRRPPVEQPPAELLCFRADDWLSGLPNVSPVQAWHDARFEWARTHPNDFGLGGDVIDMIFERGSKAERA